MSRESCSRIVDLFFFSLSSSPSLLAKSNIEHVQQLSLAPSLSLRIDMMLFLFLFFIPSFISFCYWNPVSLSFLSPSLHILFCSEFSVSRPSSSLDIRWQHSRPEVKWIHISNCCLCCCYYFYFFMQILWFFPSLLSNAWSRLRLPHATAGFSFFIRGDCPSFFNREWKRKKRKKSRLTKCVLFCWCCCCYDCCSLLWMRQNIISTGAAEDFFRHKDLTDRQTCRRSENGIRSWKKTWQRSRRLLPCTLQLGLVCCRMHLDYTSWFKLALMTSNLRRK